MQKADLLAGVKVLQEIPPVLNCINFVGLHCLYSSPAQLTVDSRGFQTSIRILQVPGLNLSSAVHYKSEADKNLMAPIASLLEGQYSQKALQVHCKSCIFVFLQL